MERVKINKTIALLLLIANAFYLLIGITRFFEPDYRPTPGAGSLTRANYITYIVPYYFGLAFFGIVLYIGLFWLLFVFKEGKLVKSGLIVNFACKLFVALFSTMLILLQNVLSWDLTAVYESVKFLIQVGTGYMVITCFFVKHPIIKFGFMLFAILNGLFFIPEYLPSHLTPAWYYKNADKLSIIPFVATMLLYMRVYIASKKQKDEDITAPETSLAPGFNFEQNS